MKSSFNLVLIQPGATALHRIPSGPWSTATARVNACSPPFEAQYAGWRGLLPKPSIDPMLMIDPFASLITEGHIL